MTMTSKRVCPVCGKGVKALANGQIARHGHNHGAGIGGGGCLAWKTGQVEDRAILEKVLDWAVRDRNVKAAERIKAKIAALPE